MTLASNLLLGRFILGYRHFLAQPIYIPTVNACFITTSSSDRKHYHHHHSFKKLEFMSKKRNYNTMSSKLLMMASSPSTTPIHPNNIQQEETMGCKKLLIVLAGPTAVGKSSVGSKLCSPEMATDIMTNHARSNTKSNDTNISICDKDENSKKEEENENKKQCVVLKSSIGHIISNV